MTDEENAVNPYSGNFILEQLQRFGSDVNCKHDMTFWLYFPNKNSAEQAAHRAKKTGLKPKVSPPLKNSPCSEWLCLLYCPHIQDETILDGISEFCTQLATEFNGEYDGWEAKLELEEDQNPVLSFKERSNNNYDKNFSKD